jgi:phosphoribosylformylglycinamidine synthase
LPGGPKPVAATLTNNDSGHYESRWVRLLPTPGLSPFVTDSEMIELPVGHGEGKFVVSERSALADMESAGQVVLRYCDEQGRPTEDYPANPNGSLGAVAGVCDPTGRIFGLMPHPDRHFDPLLHPRWTRRGLAAEGDGLRLFRNAVEALR